jgi:hypothetical protein
MIAGRSERKFVAAWVEHRLSGAISNADDNPGLSR